MALIYGSDVDTTLQNLRELGNRLRSANLWLKPKKSHFFKKEVSFLGHVVGENGIQTNPVMVKAVTNWPVPCTRKDVMFFLGTVRYYRRFIPNYILLSLNL